MAVSATAFSRVLLGATNATLYTVPASTTAVITNVVLTNTTATAASATVYLDGIPLVAGQIIAANSVATLDVRQPLATTKTITGFSGTASAIACHIGGVAIT